jgi:hypothetical protein
VSVLVSTPPAERILAPPVSIWIYGIRADVFAAGCSATTGPATMGTNAGPVVTKPVEVPSTLRAAKQTPAERKSATAVQFSTPQRRATSLRPRFVPSAQQTNSDVGLVQLGSQPAYNHP